MKINWKKLTLTVILFLNVSISFAMTNNVQHPTSDSSNEINAFWQTGTFTSFIGIDNVKINYAQFLTAPNAECIVISPGRVESYIKYQELTFELNQHGYNVFIIDHRGQGLSQRMAANSHKGYVKKFDDYAHDLAIFINQRVIDSCDSNIKPILIAHSMGGAIATRVLQLYPELVKAAVLSSPMFAINNGGIPLWLAKSLIHSGTLLNNVLSDEPWYFFGQGNYNPSSFANNRITHSQSRYQRFIDSYQRQPEVQLGGVTFQWLSQALQANNDIFDNISKIKAQVLILQAGEDTIVDNAAQDDFCDLLHQQNERLCQSGKPIRIDGAYHEIFFEQNKYRQQAINTTLKWLADLQ